MSEMPDGQDQEFPPADIFRIDTRSLAAMRIGIGLILLWEAFRRATIYYPFFTETGPSPAALFAIGSQKWQSLFFLSTHPAWPCALFAVQAVFGVMLAVGWRTRLATLGSLVLFWSQINRNYM